MEPTWEAVTGAIIVLFGSVALKAWSTIELWNRYHRRDYWLVPEARRLFLTGKITPLTACLAIVTLAYATGLWWLEVPAWLFFAVIAFGVVRRIREAIRFTNS